MLIDFHTHIFPDRVAPKAILSLKAGVKECEGIDPENYTDATYQGLLKSMEENSVTTSIVLPIVTNPKKHAGLNDFAQTIRNPRVISFGSVHPMQSDAVDAVYALRDRGFIGIKLHPEFQFCFIDEKESIDVLLAAEDAGLMVMLHAGRDIGMPDPVHCTPKRLKNALNYVSGKNIIAAHMGGWRMWDEVEECLVGTDIYMDTAFVKDYISREQFLRIVENHGEDKILFGSDSPWETPLHTLEFIKSTGLSEETIEKITHKNAEEIFKRYRI